MPFVKVTYSSPYNISVRGEDYFEVLPEQLDEEGNISASVLDDIWQEAVNAFMSDTYTDVVENEGD